MNPDSLLSPAAAKALPRGSKDRALAALAMRQLWHLVFDPCPRLLRSRGPNEWALLEPFLEHAAAKSLSMRWSLHGWLLLWLESSDPASVTGELIQELLAAAAARWAVSDLGGAEQGILLRSSSLPERGVAGWKGLSPSEPHRVVLLNLQHAAPAGSAVDFALLPDRNYPAAPRWEPLPV